LNQTIISDNLSKYGGFSDVQLLELVTDQSNKFLVTNLLAVQDFLKKWQPSFVGTFGLNEFRNINPLKRVSVSRTSYGKSLIKNGSVNLYDSNIKLDKTEYLDMEEALDLALLIPYNPLNLENKRHFNVYMLHSEQRQ